MKNAVEQVKELYPQEKNMKQGDEDTSCKSLESLHSDIDEEVVGIITMENLIEELLQVQVVANIFFFVRKFGSDSIQKEKLKARLNVLPLEMGFEVV